jgi:tetratricopeptide (TPR) repeat protein
MGDDAEALKCFRKATEIDPTVANYWYERGSMYYLFDNWYSAIECYDKAIAIDPNHGNYWASKGSAHERIMLPLDHTGQDHRAIAKECYENAVSLSPTAPLGWVKKIQRLEKEKRYLEAIRTCDMMLVAIPDYDDFVNIHKGKSLFGLGQYEKAIEYYDKVLEKEPSHLTALRGKEEALEALGRK